MFKKLISATLVSTILTLGLYASEEVSQDSQSAEVCEKDYSACLSKCEGKEGENLESCYDVCDETYSKCLEAAQSN